MITPSRAQWQASRRFLRADDAVPRSAAQWGDAAARLLDGLRLGLAPLIGTGGFDALFARAVNLAAAGRVMAPSDLENDGTESTAKLNPAAGIEMEVAVFAAFFALITTFIGQTLTDKILLQVGFPITLSPPQENDQ